VTYLVSVFTGAVIGTALVFAFILRAFPLH